VQEFGSEKAGQYKNKITTMTTYSTSVEPTPKARKKFLPKKKDLKCFQANENIYGFCLLNCSSEKSIKKGDWICCQVCKTWYRELCVGAFREKTLYPWKLCLIETVPHCDRDCTTCGTISIKLFKHLNAFRIHFCFLYKFNTTFPYAELLIFNIRSLF
jgi:hypothetical protein